MRTSYRFLSVWGDVRAARRGPGAFVRRQGRKEAHKRFGRMLRSVLKP